MFYNSISEFVEDLFKVILTLAAVSAISPLARWLWGFDPYEKPAKWLKKVLRKEG